MRMLTGAILIVASEQAFAHSQSIPFPNQVYANQVLFPTSLVLAGLGIVFLVWGVLTETRGSCRPRQGE